MTAVKVKIKGQGAAHLCFVNGQGHYFQSTAHYISMFDFKVQFMQVYGIIQNLVETLR